ncbi:MAG: hypothetical protein ACM3ME_06705 [Chloroflexota bacterium]
MKEILEKLELISGELAKLERQVKMLDSNIKFLLPKRYIRYPEIEQDQQEEKK